MKIIIIIVIIVAINNNWLIKKLFLELKILFKRPINKMSNESKTKPIDKTYDNIIKSAKFLNQLL